AEQRRGGSAETLRDRTQHHRGREPDERSVRDRENLSPTRAREVREGESTGQQEGGAHPPCRRGRIPAVVAKLYFRYGAMNSGKSTAMLQAAYNYEERGHQVLLAKPRVDTKGDTDIVSRLGVRRPVDFMIAPDDDVWDVFNAHRATRTGSMGLGVSCLLI